MVTPWEFLSLGGPDSSTIVDLEEGKIIHVGFLFKDYDTSEAYEGSYDFPPMHEVWRNVDLAADFMLLPIAADLSTIAGTVSSLLRDYRTGVPLLKDLPGWFFGLRYLFGVSRKDVEPYGDWLSRPTEAISRRGVPIPTQKDSTVWCRCPGNTP